MLRLGPPSIDLYPASAGAMACASATNQPAHCRTPQIAPSAAYSLPAPAGRRASHIDRSVSAWPRLRARRRSMLRLSRLKFSPMDRGKAVHRLPLRSTSSGESPVDSITLTAPPRNDMALRLIGNWRGNQLPGMVHIRRKENDQRVRHSCICWVSAPEAPNESFTATPVRALH